MTWFVGSCAFRLERDGARWRIASFRFEKKLVESRRRTRSTKAAPREAASRASPIVIDDRYL